MEQSVQANVITDLAPTGRLRAAINFGNPVLAQQDPLTNQPRGVSPDLARALAQRLNVPLDFVLFDAAGKVLDAVRDGAWDIAFLAVDPVRERELAFTMPYVVIEGCYLVRANSPFRDVASVDQYGVRVAVGRGSAYDLYLTRSLKRAYLVREATSSAAVERFMIDGLEVAAGIKQPLLAFAGAHAGLKLIEPCFMSIRQAMATPHGRNAGAHYLRVFVEQMKATGFIAKALQASGQHESQA